MANSKRCHTGKGPRPLLRCCPGALPPGHLLGKGDQVLLSIWSTGSPPFPTAGARTFSPSSTDRVRVGALLKGRWIPLPQEVMKIQSGREARRTPRKLLPGTPGVRAQCAYAYFASSPSPGHGQQSRDFPDPQGSKSAGRLQAQGLSWSSTEMVGLIWTAKWQ